MANGINEILQHGAVCGMVEGHGIGSATAALLTYIPQLMALKDSASAPVVRPSTNNAVEIKRLLDAGFYNFLVPFVESVDEARQAVAATRYPPQGMRGVSVSQRSNHYGTVTDYFKGRTTRCV
jgi:2-dehydro-3-deoxyglucarate aldolase